MNKMDYKDSLELLLGDCDPERMASARRVTTAMRLLLANTREGRSPSAAVRTDSARDELISHRRRRLGDRLSDLLAHAARAHTPEGSFLRFPAPQASYTDTWSALLKILDQQERDRLGLEVPLPSASGAVVLARILDAHGQHAAAVPGGVEELHHLHWRARVTWLLNGESEPMLESLRRIAQRARPLGAGEARRLLDGILADTLALHLDGGSLGQAIEIVQALGWMEQSKTRGPSGAAIAPGTAPLMAGEDSRARAYAAMTCWLNGTTDIAPRWAGTSSPFGEGVPQRWTQILDCLGPPVAEPDSGDFLRSDSTGRGVHAPGPQPERSKILRRDLGARAMIVRFFDGARGLRVASADVAPALKDELKGWERNRQFAASEPGTPEHVMVGAGRRASAIVQSASAPLRFGLGTGASRLASDDSRGVQGPLAVICEPLFDGTSELVGCLWIEFDHRLLPSDEDLRCAARVVARVVARELPRRRVAPRQPEPIDTTQPTPLCPAEPSRMAIASGASGGAHAANENWTAAPQQDDLWPLRSAWIELLDRVLGKTQERRWAAFHWDCVGGDSGPKGEPNTHVGPRGHAVCVAMGGDGELGDWNGGAEPVLRRSMMAAATIRYGRSGAGVTSFAGALQGATIPLVSGGMVIGALVVESSRRGDLSTGDIDRWSTALNLSACRLEVAHIHGRDLGLHGGGGFNLDASAPDARLWLAQIRVLSRAQSDVLVLGELGSGRRTAARAIHHAGALLSDPGPLETVEAFGMTAWELEARLAGAERGSLVLAGIDSLDHAAQGILASWMVTPRNQRARLLATAGGEGDPQGASGSAPVSVGGQRQDRPKIQVGSFPGVESEGSFASGLQLEHRQLATSLMRAVLRVVPLRNRRHWIPPMAKAILGRIAAREGGGALDLSDEAAALLWRQPWPGNALDLEALLYGAFLAKGEQSEGQLSTSDLEEAFRGLGALTIGRLASRDPRIGDLAAAAWTTQTASGRINKTRAALYLGWDPATVTTRIREAGLGELDAAALALG